MKILLTGVAGFIGSNIALRLLENGHDVVGIDSITSYYDARMKRANLSRLAFDNFTFVEGDINLTELDPLIAGASAIIHQAGQPGVRGSWGQEFEIYINANILATQRLLEAAVRADSDIKFVYASSSSVYGNAEAYPTVELDRPQPVSPYGVTKLAGEHLATLYAANYGLSTVSLRYFTVYGPRQRPDMAFTRFARAAVRDEAIVVYGSGQQIRDFTYIDDVVEANLAVTFQQVAPGSVFNVAGGGSISVNEVLDILAEYRGKPLTVERIERVKGDVFRTGGNIDAIQKAVGWKPAVPVSDGLRRQYDWAAEWFG